MKYIFLLLILPGTCFGYFQKFSTKPKLKFGDSVRTASCKTRNGQRWIPTSAPGSSILSAKLVPTPWCGQRGTVVSAPKRACAPPESKLDSCDPWSYNVRITKTDELFELNELELGLYKENIRNTLMDIVDDRKHR